MSDQHELDLGRSERNAENVDRQLESKAVAAMQRAVVWLLIAHHDVKIIEGHRALMISQRAAAAWCREHAKPAIGKKCDHTAILRAFQAWVDRGVMVSRGNKWWFATERLRTWFESLPADDDLPIFSPVVTGGDERCALVTGGDAWCVPQSLSDGVIEESSSFEEKENALPRSLDHSIHGRTATQQASPAITAAIAELPDLPVGVWDRSRTDSVLESTLRAWWAEHCLNERLGELASDVGLTLYGLIQISRKKSNPAGYFAHARRQPRAYLVGTGREWLAQVDRARQYVGR